MLDFFTQNRQQQQQQINLAQIADVSPASDRQGWAAETRAWRIIKVIVDQREVVMVFKRTGWPADSMASRRNLEVEGRKNGVLGRGEQVVGDGEGSKQGVEDEEAFLKMLKETQRKMLED